MMGKVRLTRVLRAKSMRSEKFLGDEWGGHYSGGKISGKQRRGKGFGAFFETGSKFGGQAASQIKRRVPRAHRLLLPPQHRNKRPHKCYLPP